jgi:16S rRNA A1518/A1519 N6-dimethyltransferase RsmA/KsgA/DIM1 with predicted DNA glycosylase/AP lyase activity
MLAPRKKLWTTPKEVVECAILMLQPQADEVVFDIGAGEGNFIIRCSEMTPARCCIGVEIDEERAALAGQYMREHAVDPARCKMIVNNALEEDYSSGTCFFLYLIPRGLKIVEPILLNVGRPIRVVTYMSPLPNQTPVKVEKVGTELHPEAQWPLFYYELNNA